MLPRALLALFMTLFLCSPGTAQETTPDPTHQALQTVWDRLLQADALEHRYTYSIYRRIENSDDKSMYLHNSEEYELTWIGDLPYLRLRAAHGQLLTGSDLKKEQELYDKFVAQHQKLDVEERIKLQGGHGIHCPTHPSLSLGDKYTLHDLGTEKTSTSVKHVIQAVPNGFTPKPGECPWRYTFWFDDATSTLYHLRSDVPGDTSLLCSGAYIEDWFQVIDGFPRRFHSEDHFFFPKGKHRITIEDEESYANFRRFRATVTLGAAKELPPDNTPPK